MCLFIAIFRMFTIWQMSHEGVNNMLSLIHTTISNVHCFAYISMWVENICTIMQQYFKSLFLNISASQGKQYVHFYIKCLLLRIYPRVGVNNMQTFIQQYFKCLLFRIYPQVGENHMCISYPYVKCLLFRIYSRVGVNNT